MNRLYGLFGLLLFISCSQHTTRVLTITGDREIIPEGITIDKNTIFISSILKSKILHFDLKKQTVTDFISTNEYNFKSGVGLFVKDGLLFALTNSSIKHNEISKPYLYVFKVSDKKLLKIYELDDGKNHFWNDLTVNSLNEVFISDTRQNKVYKIKYPEEKIADFYSDATTILPNGLDISTDEKKLFIASTKYGVRILDIQSKKILNRIDTTTAGIDGLKYYKGSIFAVRNNDDEHNKHRLLHIYLSKLENSIQKVETLSARDDLWNVPTTLDIQNGYIYLLANSQMDNLDQNNSQIINKNILTDTYILKIKVKKRWLTWYL